MKNIQNKTIKTGMDNNSARLVGILFLTAMVASLLGGGLVDSVISSADYLTGVSANKLQLLIGVLLEMTNGIAVVGIASLMYPILKKYSKGMAAGYLSMRIIEAVFCCFIVVTPLSLLAISQEYAKAGALDAQYFQAAGALTIAQRAMMNELLIPVFFCLGALLFYSLLYKTKIIPRFVSVWGFVSVIMVLFMNIFMLFQTDSLSTGVLMTLALPMILNEIFLGVWLIVKGFNSSAIAHLYDKTEPNNLL